MGAIGLVFAAGSALCYGFASVLQGAAARMHAHSAASAHGGGGMRLASLVGLATRAPYVAGLLLDLGGFAFSVLALRLQPLYVVQAIIAASLAVTAIGSGVVFHVRLAGREWLAIAAVCAGLAMLGVSAGEQNARGADIALRVALLAGTCLLAVAAAVIVRATGSGEHTTTAAVMGLIAGLGFAAVALAARMVPSLRPARLATDPALYALIVGAAVGTLFFAAALQRGAVTTVTAVLTVGETIVPALVGLLVLHDAVRTSAAPLVVAGFVVSLGGTLFLARFGEVPAEAR